MTEAATKQPSLLEAGVVREEFKINLFKDRDYVGRMYQWHGVKGVGVSTATSCEVPLSRQDWYKRKSYADITKTTNGAATTGTEAHKLIETEGKNIEVTPPAELQNWFDDWKRVQSEYDVSAEYSEVPIFHQDYEYGGTVDRVGEFNGKRYVIDLKTGRFDFSHLWKTEAYRQAYIHMTGDESVGTLVLYIPRPDLAKRGYKAKHYTVDHHDSCMLTFLCIYQTFRMRYFRDLIKAGMDKDTMFNHLPFKYYEEMKREADDR